MPGVGVNLQFHCNCIAKDRIELHCYLPRIGLSSAVTDQGQNGVPLLLTKDRMEFHCY